MDLCYVDLVGISVLEFGGMSGMFCWYVVVGVFMFNFYGMMFWEVSFCGMVMECDCVFLFI